MPLRPCMQSHTRRELRAWLAWLEMQWNKPSRSDFFLMRIAQRIQQSFSKTPGSVTLDQQRVKFEPDVPVKRKLTPQEIQRASDSAKRRWLGWLGIRSKSNGQ